MPPPDHLVRGLSVSRYTQRTDAVRQPQRAERGSPLQTAHLAPLRLSGLTFIDEELPNLHRPALLGLTLRLGPTHIAPSVLFPQAGNVHADDAVGLGLEQDPALEVLSLLPQCVDDHIASFPVLLPAQKFVHICHLGAQGAVKGH